MQFESIFRRVADGRKPQGAFESGLQRMLGILSPMADAGAAIHRILYESGLRERQRLSVPTLSVGNLTLGGSGKTPFTIWLVQQLKRLGRKPAVVSRGYGREDEERLVIVHDGKKLRSRAKIAGDEPVMIAEALGDTPVVACANRYRAGRLAIKKFAIDTIVLDDGFQHHRLDRDGDFVLVDSTRLISRLKVFPAGTLRESASGLRRAHLVVITRWNQAKAPGKVLLDVKREAVGVPVVRMALGAPAFRTFEGEEVSAEMLRDKTAVVYCAVASPKSVVKSARSAGLRIRGVRALPDHAPMHRGRVHDAQCFMREKKADTVIVTEKDAVKMREQGVLPEGFLIMSAAIEPLETKDGETALKVIKTRLHRKRLRGFLR